MNRLAHADINGRVPGSLNVVLAVVRSGAAAKKERSVTAGRRMVTLPTGGWLIPCDGARAGPVALPRLQCYLRDAPRRRPSQAAKACAFQRLTGQTYRAAS